jgi:hypothetical protein
MLKSRTDVTTPASSRIRIPTWSLDSAPARRILLAVALGTALLGQLLVAAPTSAATLTPDGNSWSYASPDGNSWSYSTTDGNSWSAGSTDGNSWSLAAPDGNSWSY